MPVDLHTQIKHDALPHHLHRVRLEVLQNERAYKHNKKRECNTIEPFEVPGRNMIVNSQLR